MPIEKEFKYQNEADFTSHFLVPCCVVSGSLLLLITMESVSLARIWYLGKSIDSGK